MASDDPVPREQLIAEVLRSDEPHERARQLAQTHSLPPAAVWQWAIEHARRHAHDTMPPERVEAALRDEDRWDALRGEVERDRTLAMANRLHEVLHAMPLDAAAIRAAFGRLPADGRHDHHLEVLLLRDGCPTDLLESLIAQGRSITPIAHRGGPRHVLELVRTVYFFDEPVLTLLRDHYMPPDEPLDALLRFVDEVGSQFADAIEHNLPYWTECPPERRAAVLERLQALAPAED